jgi:phosphate transport system permease protein
MSLMAIAIGTPIGIAAGTFLAEYVNHHKLGTVIRFVNDILLSAPSIVLACSCTRSWSRRWGIFRRWPARSRSASSCCRWWCARPT